MAKFKHHSYFQKAKAEQQFRFPFVCFSCRKSFKYPARAAKRVCPQCRSPLEMLSRKFSAPKSNDVSQWQKVRYLVEHGFRFHSVYQSVESGGKLAVPYPATLEEAKSFVQAFRPQVQEDAA
jgi:predicted amidophosphoribosyltransferase